MCRNLLFDLSIGRLPATLQKEDAYCAVVLRTAGMVAAFDYVVDGEGPGQSMSARVLAITSKGRHALQTNEWDPCKQESLSGDAAEV